MQANHRKPPPEYEKTDNCPFFWLNLAKASRHIYIAIHAVCTYDFSISSSSSQYCAGQRLAPHNRTLGDLEWEVESTTVTHSSADWWDLLLPLA